MKKKIDAVKMVREIRNKRYEAWVNDPIAFEKRLFRESEATYETHAKKSSESRNIKKG